MRIFLLLPVLALCASCASVKETPPPRQEAAANESGCREMRGLGGPPQVVCPFVKPRGE